MTSWQIAPGTERVELKDGKAEVVFTVTNPGPVDRRATVDIVGSEQGQSSWFNIAEPQQLIPHGGSKQFTVSVEPGDKAASGTHWLAGRVYSADAAPEEDSVTSDRVSFEIKPPPEKPKSRWWLWALIGGVLLLAVVVVVAFVVLRGDQDVPDVRGRAQAEAEQLINDSGLVPNVEQQPSETVENGHVISQDPGADSSATKGSTVTIVVSTGSDLVQVPPGLVGQNVVSAILKVQKAGLTAVLVPTRSLQPKDRVVDTDPKQGIVPDRQITLYVSTGNIIAPTLEPLPICSQHPQLCVIKHN